MTLPPTTFDLPAGPVREGFIIRHREPFWAYIKSQRSGTAHLNYVNKNGRRTLRLHIQIKERGNWKVTKEQVSVIIPLPLINRLVNRIRKDGPINSRERVTFELKRFRRAPP